MTTERYIALLESFAKHHGELDVKEVLDELAVGFKPRGSVMVIERIGGGYLMIVDDEDSEAFNEMWPEAEKQLRSEVGE